MVGAVGSLCSAIEELLGHPAGGGAPVKQSGSIFPDQIKRFALMPPQDQGQTNACGTTSLAMSMSYLLGREIDHGRIDEDIRRLDGFSSPNDLVAYARDAGLNAEMYNHGSPEELARFVDKGVPTQILVSVDGSGDMSSMHYVVVTGYERDSAGKLAFTILNPAGGCVETWGAAELEEKWGDTPAGFIAVNRF